MVSKSAFVTRKGTGTFLLKLNSNDPHRSGLTVIQPTGLEIPVVDSQSITHVVQAQISHNNSFTVSPFSQQEYQQPPHARISPNLHSSVSPTSLFPPSTYPTSTLPEYHARSLSPPSYSDFSASRSQSIRTPSMSSGNERFWSLGSDTRPPSLTTQVEHSEKQ